MRRSVAITIKAGLVLSMLVGFDKLVLDPSTSPSAQRVQRKIDGTSGRRGKRSTTTTTQVAATTTTTHAAHPTVATLPPSVPTTAPAPTAATTAPATTATTAVATTPAPTPATTAAATTTTTHTHTGGGFPTVWTPSPGPRAGEPFVENFDADPLTPQPWKPDNWDIQYHSRDIGTWVAPEPMMGHNSDTCGAAPAEHAITTWKDSTYVCLHHLMTAVKAEGYGAIYLTPPAMVDFAQQGVIQWSNSTLLTSDRDWQDVWISPYDVNLVTPLYEWLPDLQGEPVTAVHVSRDFGRATWFVNVVRGHQSTQVASLTEPADLPRTQAGVTAYEIRLTRTGITFGLPERNLWTSATVADLGFSTGVVQFGHHSYNPTKNGGDNKANSWSWDTFRIAPTKPLTITTASPRLMMDNGGSITFPPAPANARLRFSGVCAIEMNTGSGWQKLATQPQEQKLVEHFSSYFVPIPQGTTTASFRFTGEGWYTGFPCAVKDAHVWTAG